LGEGLAGVFVQMKHSAIQQNMKRPGFSGGGFI